MMLMLKITLRVAAIAMLLQLALAKGKTYKVGGPHGLWNEATKLQPWANSNKFYVGDSISFEYREGDMVVQVWKPDYDACNATKPIMISATGNCVVTLTSPGISYFISGIPGECLAGVKLAVTVLSSETTPSPPEATPSAASPPVSSTPSETTPSPPEATHSAASPPVSSTPSETIPSPPKATPSAVSAPVSSTPSPTTDSGGSPVTSPTSLVWAPSPSVLALPTALDIGSPKTAPSPSTLLTSSELSSSADNKVNVFARFTMGLGFTILMLL